MSYTPSNSHDPKTDHRSMMLLVLFACLIVGSIVAAFTLPKEFDGPVDLGEPVATFADCTMWEFDAEGGKGYVAKCPKDNVATTDAKGRHIVTEVN